MDLFKSIFIKSMLPSIVIDEQGMILECNDSSEKLFQYTRSEILGYNIKKIIPSFTYTNQKVKVQKKDDHVVEIFLSISPFTMHNQVIHVIVFHDIEFELYSTIIEDITKLDPLTHLFNRQFALLKLKKLINKHQQQKTRFCFLLLDINNFKSINDRYGAQIGDELLISFSKRISSFLNKTDFFARVGGNEFLLVLEKTDNISKIASSLQQVNNAPYKLHQQAISCGLTIGATCYPEGGKTKEELLNHATFALYDAKRKNKNICIFSKQSKQFFEKMRGLESDIQQAFFKKEFHMLYQPQVNLKTGEILGLEALIRWDHPQEGLFEPDFFLPILEECGLSERLNEYALEKVLNDISILNLGKPLNIAVNISLKINHIEKHMDRLINIVQLKQQMLTENKINLEFELTESSFNAYKSAKLGSCLMQFKQQGIRCAMDDFGIGYSSIKRLTQHQFDTVKIDKVFTQKLDRRGKKSAVTIIKALIQLSQDLNFKIIAEGPETRLQIQKLLEVGCLYGQGFYFYKPMLITKARQLIKKQKVI